MSGRGTEHGLRGGVRVIDDSYNANPASLRAAVDVLAAAPAGWVVLGDMGELGAEGPRLHREAGAYMRAAGMERLFTLGPLRRRGRPRLRRGGCELHRVGRSGGRTGFVAAAGGAGAGQGLALRRHGASGGRPGRASRHGGGGLTMLLALANWLEGFYSGFNVFQYLTFRAILGTLTALGIALLVGPALIRRLSALPDRAVRPRRRPAEPSVQGRDAHHGRCPDPGGSLPSATLLWSDLGNRFVWMVLLVTLAFGLIGGVDDWLKLTRGNSHGLSARTKYLAQSVVGLVAALVLFASAATPVETSAASCRSSRT
ncbi:MAG: cyanophycin synthetase [Arhodomonas sp.]|nr:cyanophycin synthetase [Arhodomonas sp.]